MSSCQTGSNQSAESPAELLCLPCAFGAIEKIDWREACPNLGGGWPKGLLGQFHAHTPVVEGARRKHNITEAGQSLYVRKRGHSVRHRSNPGAGDIYHSQVTPRMHYAILVLGVGRVCLATARKRPAPHMQKRASPSGLPSPMPL